MILLYIVLMILFFLVLILFIPMHLIVSYDEKLKVQTKILGIKFTVFDQSKKKIKTRKSKKTIEKSKKEPEKNSEKKGLMQSIKMVSKLIKTSKDLIKDILGSVSIEDFTFRLKIAGKDASSTAIHYGQASSIVYSAFGLIYSIKKPINYEVNVFPDFKSEKISLQMNLDVKEKLFFIVRSVIKFAKRWKEISKN